MTSTLKIFTDRSRAETAQHCLRERWLRYHQDGMGLEPSRKPLPLAVGGAVHVGLETLLRAMMDADLVEDFLAGTANARMAALEGEAVAVAIADLSRYRGALALDGTEAADQAKAPAQPPSLGDSLLAMAESLGLSVDDPAMDALRARETPLPSAFDDYLWTEQSALVEGMVRAYARRRLRPLLEEYEVLEVEREGTWELAEAQAVMGSDAGLSGPSTSVTLVTRPAIVFCSRPDALLRSRADNNLYLLSYKTAASWDRRKEMDARHDAQGLSEGVEVERRLGQWWERLQDTDDLIATLREEGISKPIADYLATLLAPPRILGIRYEYLLKGERWRDSDLSARYGFDARSQKSPLIRRYVAHSQPKRGESRHALGDHCWSFNYLNDDGTEGKLYYGHWKSELVSDVKAWIDRLDSSEETMSGFDSTVGMEPRSLGWKSSAQAVGFTREHPLDSVFIPPITIYRSDDDLFDWLESTEAQEVKIAEAVELVNHASDDGERRSLLNRHFPMSRRSCSYPSECVFSGTICFAGAEAKENPLGTGKFVPRIPHHAPEMEGR